MAMEKPFPELEELVTMVGEAGRRMSGIGAGEGTAGNISVYIGWPIDPHGCFPLVETIEMPLPMPELAGASFLVSGSGRRLREIIQEPAANLGFVVVDGEGKKGLLHTSPRRLFARVTSEFNSHMAVHRDQIRATGTNFHTILHAHPPHLTYLSQIPRYQNQTYWNRHLLRWQPELIINLPEGIGFVPFQVPGSPGLMYATLEALRTQRVVVWAKHGVMARSETSVKHASDCIEYAETAAHYEHWNLANQEQGEGLSVEEIRAICRDFNVEQSIF
jgi:rhamnulose-1-phosphate aldolase